MKLFRYLYTKPKHVRDQYAFMGAFIITGLLAGVWGVTGVVSGRYALTEVEEVHNEEKSSPFFSTIIAQFKEQFASVGKTDQTTEVLEDTLVPATENPSAATFTLTPETIEAVQAASSTPTPVEYRVVQITTVSSTTVATTTSSSTGE